MALIALSRGRQARAPGAGSSRDQEGHGGQDTLAEQLPADIAPPTPISSFWLLWWPRQWGLEGGSAGRSVSGEAGRKEKRETGSHCSPPPAQHPPAPIRVPEMLGRTPGPPLPGASARPVPSYFLFYWPLWPGPSQPQTSVTWDSQGSRWPLQGAAGETGDAAAARSHSQRSGD